LIYRKAISKSSGLDFLIIGNGSARRRRWLRDRLRSRLRQGKSAHVRVATHINRAFNGDLELAVIDYDGVHAPCRRILTGWLKSGTQDQIYVRPTHWREWKDA